MSKVAWNRTARTQTSNFLRYSKMELVPYAPAHYDRYKACFWLLLHYNLLDSDRPVNTPDLSRGLERSPG
jgi:hypothetical protein